MLARLDARRNSDRPYLGALTLIQVTSSAILPVSASASAALCRGFGSGQPRIFRDRPRPLPPYPLGHHILSRRGRN
ncbi:hypothetical protein, partial [Bradyrhizobium sp.]|uniref:hypothetical protein n=1 Tax=Bradyrhizobium sp. TaxID=376 RepID=UPI003C66D430